MHARFGRVAVVLALSAVLVFALSLGVAASPALGKGPKKPAAKNIILMISDGQGYNHVQAADYYEYGTAGRQLYESYPFRVAVATYSADGTGYDPALAWSDFGYVMSGYADSAAAATAVACGVRTYDAAVGVDPSGNPAQSILEVAEELGKATGVVSTVEMSHATPAAFVAHNVHRDNYEAIAQDMVASAADVIMGAGHPWYDDDGQLRATPNTFKYVGGAVTWDALVAGTAGGDANGDGLDDPWVLIQTRAEFQALQSGPTPTRVCGIMQAYTTAQQARSGDAMAAPYAVSRNQQVPTLAEMTASALNILDDDPDGLFLMVEGGAVDWASHSNQPGRMIEEQVDFNQAVAAVNQWVEQHSNWGETLVVVTADHETGYVWGAGSNPGWLPLVSNGPGAVPGMAFYSTNHTNSLVPLYAKGGGGNTLKSYAANSDPVRGPYVTNVDVGQALFGVFQGQ